MYNYNIHIHFEYNEKHTCDTHTLNDSPFTTPHPPENVCTPQFVRPSDWLAGYTYDCAGSSIPHFIRHAHRCGGGLNRLCRDVSPLHRLRPSETVLATLALALPVHITLPCHPTSPHLHNLERLTEWWLGWGEVDMSLCGWKERSTECARDVRCASAHARLGLLVRQKIAVPQMLIDRRPCRMQCVRASFCACVCVQSSCVPVQEFIVNVVGSRDKRTPKGVVARGVFMCVCWRACSCVSVCV